MLNNLIALKMSAEYDLVLRLFSKYSIDHLQKLFLSHRYSNIIPVNIYIWTAVVTAKHLLSMVPKVNIPKITSYQLFIVFVLNWIDEDVGAAWAWGASGSSSFAVQSGTDSGT